MHSIVSQMIRNALIKNRKEHPRLRTSKLAWHSGDFIVYIFWGFSLKLETNLIHLTWAHINRWKPENHTFTVEFVFILNQVNKIDFVMEKIAARVIWNRTHRFCSQNERNDAGQVLNDNRRWLSYGYLKCQVNESVIILNFPFTDCSRGGLLFSICRIHPICTVHCTHSVPFISIHKYFLLFKNWSGVLLLIFLSSKNKGTFHNNRSDWLNPIWESVNCYYYKSFFVSVIIRGTIHETNRKNLFSFIFFIWVILFSIGYTHVNLRAIIWDFDLNPLNLTYCSGHDRQNNQ